MAAVQPLQTTLLAAFLVLGVGTISYYTSLQSLAGSLLAEDVRDIRSCSGTATAWFVPPKRMSYAPAVMLAEACVHQASLNCAKLSAALPSRSFTFVRYAADGKTPLPSGGAPEYRQEWEKLGFTLTEKTTVMTYFACVGEPDTSPKKRSSR